MDATIEMKPVNSSNIEAAGYDGTDAVVRFQNGGQYRYKGMPVSVWEAWEATFDDPDTSSGKYFHANIRNAYPCEKI